jgi:hypothetical protein
MATTKKKSAAKKPRYGVAPSRKRDREARAAAMKSAVSSASKPRAKRHRASEYVKFDRMGNFAGYKKSTPKGYVYMPGSRYLTKTSNLRLDSNYATAEQKKFVRGNRKAVNKAIEAAMRDGAFRRPGLNSQRMVDVDLSRGGKKFADQMKEEFFGRSAGQSSPRSFGRPHAGMRRRSRWSFAFGQDGHVR